MRNQPAASSLPAPATFMNAQNAVVGLRGRDLLSTLGDRAMASRTALVVDLIQREKPTLRQVLHRLAGARGHRVVVGTPQLVADQMQLWHESGAADGFNVMPPWLPGGIEVFIEEVLPILRERGLFRTEYAGRTLREHYGLGRPASQFAHAPAPDSIYEETA